MTHFRSPRRGAWPVLLAAAAGLVSLDAQTPASTSTAAPPLQLDAFTVTGSNIRGVDRETALPITRLDVAQIELTGAQSVVELLQTLPQVETSVGNIGPTAGGPNDAGGDAASVNLRGLGDGHTLTLLNGRRLSIYGIAPNTPPVAFVNVNQIPLAALERVEVLRDGASAIYGSDAIGGVVNFILKQNYEGIEARARYGAAAGGYDELSGSVALGRRFAEGRSSISILLSYHERDGLDATDRWFSADSDKTSLVGAPFNGNFNFNGRNSTSPFGRFSRINSYNSSGGIASSTSFFVQPAASGGAELVNGVGPSFHYNPQTTRQLIGDVERTNLFATFEHALTSQTRFTAEASYYRSEAFTTTGESPISGNTSLTGTDNVIVPASNYYNPYGTRLNPAAPRDVLIRNFRAVDLGPRTFDVDVDSYRLLGALQGRFGQTTWSWETGALYMESRTKDTQGGLLSESGFLSSLARNTPDAFKVFGGPGVNSEATLADVRIEDWTRGTGELTLLDAKTSGEIAPFWGGPLLLAAGLEYRDERLRERNGPFGLADDVIAISGQINVTAQRDVYAGYAELAVPVIGESNRLPFLQTLDLNAAARYEDFGPFDAAKPKFGAAATALPWLKFRGSYGEGFRAPSISQLFQPPRSRRNTGLIDTARIYRAGGAEITPEDAASGVSKLVVTGGNPTLEAENSRSWNAGAVVDVPAVKGLAFIVDFWGITQVGRIESPDVQDELNKDNVAWDAGQGANPNIVRADRTDFDRDHNIPGTLLSINGIYRNLERREVQGFDVAADYQLSGSPLGTFLFHAEGTRYLKFRDTDANGIVTELVRQSTRPEWRAAASASWTRNAWSAGVFMRHVGGYEADESLDTNGAPYVIPSWTVFNVNVSYRFTNEWLKGTTLRLGANNVFDRDPPLNPAISDGYDAGNADPFGRLIYAELRWRF